jgi:predicted nucleotide-binding protein
MDKQEIINGLESLTNRLVVDVTEAFKERGSVYGQQRFIAWRKQLYAYFKQHLQRSIKDYNNLFSIYEIYQPNYGESAVDFFIRSEGHSIFSFLESLKLDIQNDEYDFTPLNTEVKQVKTPEANAKPKSNKVFIVHGHDEAVKERTARFLSNLDLKPMILHDLPSMGKTIIEKIEHYAQDTKFAIVLYTPDDKGNTAAEVDAGDFQYRARQNVVFEHGYLIGLLNRENVAAINVGTMELPSDINGMVYIGDDWKIKVAHEMKQAGYDIDMNKLY